VILLGRSFSRETEFNISPARLVVALAAALMATACPAFADQAYDVHGEDVYRIGASGTITRVVYDGSQRLTVEKQGKLTRYDAQARYTRNAADGKSLSDARFVQELLPNGSFQDALDEDPDFLTVLNQPFAVQLDPATMHDLHALRGAVPFDATSPLGGDAVLRGFLRPGVAGEIDGRSVIAVRFQASGPMNGTLPDHSEATMSGRINMDGIAYYAADDAMLLALDATLTIDAQLSQAQKAVPVRITYRRFIRAKTRLPTPLASGAGTESPPTP